MKISNKNFINIASEWFPIHRATSNSHQLVLVFKTFMTRREQFQSKNIKKKWKDSKVAKIEQASPGASDGKERVEQDFGEVSAK